MPRKSKKAVEPKVVALSELQKSYLKVFRKVDQDLTRNKKEVAELDAKISKLQTKQTAELQKLRDQKAKIDAIAASLETTKGGIESILAQNTPPAWAQFTKQVYDYHYHYHIHHDHDCGKGTACPYPHYPVYIGPWWGYYEGGGYITYPTQGQLKWTGDTIGNGFVTGGNLQGSGDMFGRTVNINGPTSSSVVLPPTSSGGGNDSFISHNANVSSFKLENNPIPGPNLILTTSSASINDGSAAPGPTEYTKDDASFAAAVTSLQAVGFFDMGAPPVDASDMSVADLAHSAAK